MKKFFFTLTFLAAGAAAVSCSIIEGRDEVVPVPEGEIVTLSVGISTPQTRTTGSVSEADINSLEVFVFDDSGELERSAYMTYVNVTQTASVEMNCYTGTKEIVAIVNAPKEIGSSAISKVGDLNDEVTRLDENSMGDFFMYGSTQTDVSKSGSVEITVNRRVARFVLNTVTNNIPSSSSAKNLVLSSVYLINAVGDAKYDGTETYAPKVWYNKSEYDGGSGGAYGFLYDGISGGSLASGSSYSTKHYFYCYPNLTKGRSGTTNRPTRLVVEATLDGEVWYYPVAVENVESNYSYEVDLTISGTGLDAPDSDAQIVNFTIKVDVADWTPRSCIGEF